MAKLLSLPQDVEIVNLLYHILGLLDRHILAGINSTYKEIIMGELNLLSSQEPSNEFYDTFSRLKEKFCNCKSNIDLFQAIQSGEFLQVDDTTMYFPNEGNDFFINTPCPTVKTWHVYKPHKSKNVVIFPHSFTFISMLEPDFHYLHKFGNGLCCLYAVSRIGQRLQFKNLSCSSALFFNIDEENKAKNIAYSKETMEFLIKNNQL